MAQGGSLLRPILTSESRGRVGQRRIAPGAAVSFRFPNLCRATSTFWQQRWVSPRWSRRGWRCLIRSLEDRGVLVLLDPRIRTKRYGQTFLASLPPYRMTGTITDVAEFFSENR